MGKRGEALENKAKVTLAMILEEMAADEGMMLDERLRCEELASKVMKEGVPSKRS